MAIDVRATVTCSLGTLISGNIADGYIQGNGLVLVRGSVEISGLITPAVGTAVTFAYKINGGTRNIPRKLRVLSSFADPFRRTTKVQLGCKLTYLSDLREQLKWSAFDDPENLIDYDPADYEIIPIPTRAASMMDRCLTELGITASSNPLTNKFSAGQYDFSSGWVNVLGELLVSEGYCGYLDRNEVLQVFALNQDGGTGPVVGRSELIDIGAINAGQLPGEAVVVNYSAISYKADPAPETWKKTKTSNRSSVTIRFRDPTTGAQQSRTYNVLQTQEETGEFQTLTKASTEEQISVMRYRKTVTTESSPLRLGSLLVQFLEAGITPSTPQLKITQEEWFYYDNEVNEIRTVREVYADQAYGYGEVNPTVVFNNAGVISTVSIPYGAVYLKEAEEVETLVQGSLKKIITKKYGNWGSTIAGQQAAAEGRDSFTTTTQVSNYVDALLSRKYLLGVDIRTEENTSSGQRVPFGSSALNQQYAKDGNANNGYRKDSKSEVVLALGSATAQRRIEFTLPMAPDDVFIKSGGGYSIVPNNAYNKAKAYGIIQNRLLLGNRNGMNLRLNAIQMPEAPFSPLVVSVNDAAALYRTNATSWTFSAEGLVVSTDALFWGGVSGTSPWFPVAPGVTSLPSLPTTSVTNVTGVDASGNTVTIGTVLTLTVGGVVRPYNETVIVPAATRTRMVVTNYPYSLQQSTALAVTTKTKAIAARVKLIDVPAAAVTVTAAAPSVSIGVRVVVPAAAAVSMAALTPAVASGASVAVPAAAVAVAGVVPELVGRLKTVVEVPAVGVTVAGVAPFVTSGGSVMVPVTDIAVAGVVPTQTGPSKDPLFSSVSLLLHMDGSNNSTTFTDSSSSNRTATVYASAAISTTRAVFGTASGYFPGSASRIAFTVPAFGTGDFSVELRIYIISYLQTYTSIIGTRPNGAGGIHSNDWSIDYDSGGGLYGYSDNVIANSVSAVTTGTWLAIAFTRSSGTCRMFVDGVLKGSSANTQNFTGTTLYVGATGNGSSPVNAYIDEVRVTTGQARRTASYTLDAVPFPNA